ncbi:MAG: glutathione peroxidase [Bacteroidota bacterium]
MKKIFLSLKYLLLMLFAPKGVFSKPKSNSTAPSKSFYDFTMRSIEGKEIPFSIYKGKKVLVVNTASECGFTPQFSELEQLHEKHKDKLILLGFPANNFDGQEPGSNHEIAAFCQRNFGVTFQLFEKSSVAGQDQNPLYQWLSHKEENGWNSKSPNWNFCKYLISENGELLNYYTSSINPLSNEILKQL